MKKLIVLMMLAGMVACSGEETKTQTDSGLDSGMDSGIGVVVNEDVVGDSGVGSDTQGDAGTETDASVLDASVECDESTYCVDVPEPECINEFTSIHYFIYAFCDDGECVYSYQVIDCNLGCSEQVTDEGYEYEGCN